MIRLGVLASGSGTNLQALLDAEKAGVIKSGEIVVVIASNESAYALERAKNAGVPAVAVPKKSCASQAEYEVKISAVLAQYGVELIVLAGFLSILSADFVARWPKRIINIHPSLIPSFCGEGYYGLRVHEAALQKGVKVTGATVHFVNEVPDGGEIILQKSVPVYKNDTPELLQRRVMERAEWKLLPRATEIISAKILKEGNKYGL